MIGRVGSWIEPELTAFQIGMQGMIAGENYEVIGRVRYSEPNGYAYDEWLLMNNAGEYCWLLDDWDDGMLLWHPILRGADIDIVDLQKGQMLQICGNWVRISDYGIGIVDYLEGVYTWDLRVGEMLKYVNGVGNDGVIYSQDYLSKGFECYWGQRLQRDEAAHAFRTHIRVAKA